MTRLFEKFMTLKLEGIHNVSDLGEIVSLEILNWRQLVELKHDTRLTKGLGRAIPADANPSKVYAGNAFIKVIPVRAMIREGETLKLNVLAMEAEPAPIMKYRSIGNGTWSTLPLRKVARAVYEVTIPSQSEDFEYYIESGSTKFPVTAPQICQTVVVAPPANTQDVKDTEGIKRDWDRVPVVGGK